MAHRPVFQRFYEFFDGLDIPLRNVIAELADRHSNRIDGVIAEAPTTGSSQAVDGGTFDYNVDLTLGSAIIVAVDDITSIFFEQAVAADFAIDGGTAGAGDTGDLEPYFTLVSGDGFKLTITGGANALAATDITLADDLAANSLASVVATAYETLINAAIGSGTVTVVWTGGAFIIDGKTSVSAITVAAPSVGQDKTTVLFGGTSDQDAAPTTWTGDVPNPWNDAGKIYTVILKNVTDTASLAVVEGTQAVSGSEVAPTSAELDAAAGAGNHRYRVFNTLIRRTGDTTIVQTIDNTVRPGPLTAPTRSRLSDV